MSPRRESRRRDICFVTALVFLASVLVVVAPCGALSSKECKSEVKARYEQGQQECHSPICGYLNVSDARPTFLERMSLQCQALMWQYRDDISGVLGVTRAATRMCATAKDSYQASNPIIVENEEIRSFLMCTVPRAASTNLRSLLNMLIRYPDEPRPDIQCVHAILLFSAPKALVVTAY